jgi:hypothetical protein
MEEDMITCIFLQHRIIARVLASVIQVILAIRFFPAPELAQLSIFSFDFSFKARGSSHHGFKRYLYISDTECKTSKL